MVILHNAEAVTKVINELHVEGMEITKDTWAVLPPYRKDHINRFGD